VETEVTQSVGVSPRFDPALRRKLVALRAALRWRLAAEGLARLVLVVLGAALASLVVDYGVFKLMRQYMSVGQRLVISLACLAPVLVVLWRGVIRPQMVRMTDEALALVVERTHPGLGDRLISALQFSKATGRQAAGMSRDLVAEIARQASAMAGGLDFTAGVRTDRVLRLTAGATLALAAAGGLAALQGELLGVWFQRMVLLRQHATYPRATQLRVQHVHKIVAQREAVLEVTVTAEDRPDLPSAAVVHWRAGAQRWRHEAVACTAGARNRYVKTLPPVRESMSFYVTLHGERSLEYSVELARSGEAVHPVPVVRPGETVTPVAVAMPDRMRVGRGGAVDLAVVADADKSVPAEVTFRMHYPSLGGRSETVRASVAGGNVFVKRLEPEELSETFRLYVTGGDDRTGEYVVEVAEPPQLQNVSFIVTPPAYTNQPSRPMTAQGGLEVLADSRVVMSALATKDLLSAELTLDGRKIDACRIRQAPGPDGVSRPRGLTAEFTLAAPTPPKPSVPLGVALVDSENIANPQAAYHTILLTQDQPPRVQLAAVGIASRVTPKALVPLKLTASDDYGVHELAVEWSMVSSQDRVTRLPALVLYDPPVREPPAGTASLDLRSLAAPGGAEAPTTQPTTGPATQPAPAGGLLVGDTLRLQAVAIDSRPDNPNIAYSNVVALQVIAEDQMWQELLESLRNGRDQLRRAVEEMARVRTRTDNAIEQLRKPDGLAAAKQTVAEAADTQQQINDQVGGVATRLEDVLAQMNNNRVGPEGLRRDLAAKFIAPLRLVLSSELHKVGLDLQAAGGVTSLTMLSEHLTNVLAAEDIALKKLRDILGELPRYETAQDLARVAALVLDKATAVKAGLEYERRPKGPATAPTTRP
jgi:hypothetical protein